MINLGFHGLFLGALVLTLQACSYKLKSSDSNEILIQPEVIRQEEVLENLKVIQEQANRELVLLESRKRELEKNTQEATKETEKSLLSFQLSLLKFQLKLETVRVLFLVQRENNIKNIKHMTEVLSVYERQTFARRSVQMKASDLTRVNAIWRQLADETLMNLFKSGQINFEEVPNAPEGLDVAYGKNQDLESQIKKDIITAHNKKTEIHQMISLFNFVEKELHALVLLKAGRTRSLIMNQLIAQNQFSVWRIDEEMVQDYLREVRIVPYRFLAILSRKYFEIRNMKFTSVKEWFYLMRQFSLIGLVLFLPYLFFSVFNRFSNHLDKLRRQLFVHSSMNYKMRTRMALWINRLNPYLPWVFAFLTVSVAHTLLIKAALEPITLILPYLKIYIWYRVFRMFLSTLLGQVLLSKSLDKIKAKQSLLQETARHLSILFFLEWFFLHAVEDVVRRALIYNLLLNIVIFLNIIVIALEARRWRDELLVLSENWLHFKLVTWIRSIRIFWFELIVFPILFIGNVAFILMGWVYHWIGQFEVGKKIASEIFKRKLEDATDGQRVARQPLPESYKKLFEKGYPVFDALRVSLHRTPLKTCLSLIQDWNKGKRHEDVLMLYGNYGIGKTALLNSISTSISEIKIKYLDIEDKITAPSKLYDQLSKTLDIKFSSCDEFEHFESRLDKTVLMIDNIHNLYLNKADGLEAYRALIDLVSLQTKNVFWCMTCNQRAWVHLQGLFGSNHFLGEAIELLQWSDAEIQDLILKRHRTSELRLTFDRVISAVHQGDFLESTSSIEVQFFRLLWGQSRGNPCTAQELWLSSASLGDSHSIRITVPEFTSSKTLSEANDATYLIFATLMKHENLSLHELEETCGFPLSTIKQALKFGEDGRIIERTDLGRWMIHPKAQYVIQSQLIGKNLIYE